MHCYQPMLTAREIYFYKFVLEKVFFVSYITNNLKTGPDGNYEFCFPWDRSVSN